MPHIHNEPGQHDSTISIFLFRTDFDQPKIMLHLHRKLNLLTQFGGHIELHETPWQAALHELREESGYDSRQVHVLQPEARLVVIGNAVVHPYPVAHATVGYGNDSTHFHTDTIYAITAEEEPQSVPDKDESTELYLFTKTELRELASDKIDDFTRDIALHIFDGPLVTWQKIATDQFK